MTELLSSIENLNVMVDGIRQVSLVAPIIFVAVFSAFVALVAKM